MVFNPNDPISLETVKRVLLDHENAILSTSYALTRTGAVRINDDKKNPVDLKVFAQRINFPITESLGRIRFGVPFSTIPVVTLTVEQKDPFFATAIVKSVTSTEVDFALFYSGNVSVQNYTLNVIAVGY